MEIISLSFHFCYKPLNFHGVIGEKKNSFSDSINWSVSILYSVFKLQTLKLEFIILIFNPIATVRIHTGFVFHLLFLGSGGRFRLIA